VSVAYAIDRAVVEQWLVWLDSGQVELLRAHLAGLVAHDAAKPSAPAPPSSVTPAIHTR